MDKLLQRWKKIIINDYEEDRETNASIKLKNSKLNTVMYQKKENLSYKKKLY